MLHWPPPWCSTVENRPFDKRLILKDFFVIPNRWRREWDSNPRYGFPHTRFPSVRLKPLGHLSGAPSLEGAPVILQVIAGETDDFSVTYCI